MKLIIDEFDKLDVETQIEIQDFISGHTTNYSVINDSCFMVCDVCGEDKIKPIKIESYGTTLRVCKVCIDKAEKLI